MNSEKEAEDEEEEDDDEADEEGDEEVDEEGRRGGTRRRSDGERERGRGRERGRSRVRLTSASKINRKQGQYANGDARRNSSASLLQRQRVPPIIPKNTTNSKERGRLKPTRPSRLNRAWGKYCPDMGHSLNESRH